MNLIGIRISLILIILFILLFFNTFLSGQKSIEDIWQEGMEITGDSARIDFFLNQCWDLARTNPKISAQILSRLDEEFYHRDISYKKEIWFYYKGVIEKNLGHYEESDSFLQIYYNIQLKGDNIPRLAAVQMVRANLYSDMGLWSKAMDAVTESLNLYESLGDSLGIIRTSSKLGVVLNELKRIDDAIKYHHRALNIATQLKDTAEMAIANSNIGLTYEKALKLDTALRYFEICLDLDSLIKDEYAQIYDRNNIANIYLKLDQPATALKFGQIAFTTAKRIGARSLINYSQNLMANIHLALGNIEEGIGLLQELLNEDPATSIRDLAEVHQSLYLAYKNSGNIRSAFDHLEKHHELSDSILNEEITNQINRLEIAYQTDKAHQQLELANTEKELNQIKLVSVQNRTYFLFAGLIIISLFLFYLFHLNRKIQLQKNLIQKSLNEKEVLLREIHHRVKNNLQVISSLLSLQSKSEMDPNVVSALKLGQNRVRSMALIHQNLYEDENLTGIQVRNYFEKLIKSLFHTYNISPDRIELSTDIDDLSLDVETMIPLGLILNELITNALKYAFPNQRSGTINVLIKEVNDHLQLEVADNGIGMDPSVIKETRKNFGYRLINTFKVQLKSSLEIDGQNGTRVVMKIGKYLKAADTRLTE